MFRNRIAAAIGMAAALALGNVQAASHQLTFSGYVSSVGVDNPLIGMGDLVKGLVQFDTDAPSWYGDDPVWGAYEALASITYGGVTLNAPISLYVNLQDHELFGTIQVPIDEEALIFTNFRFSVGLQDANSTSLSAAVKANGRKGSAALYTYDTAGNPIQSFAQDVEISVAAVPEPGTMLLAVGGLACLGARRMMRRAEAR